MKPLLIALLLMVSAGCGDLADAFSSPDEGTVYNKVFEPAHSEERRDAVYRTDCDYRYAYDWTSGDYKWKNVCEEVFSHYRYYDVWIEDCYRLFFKDDEGEKGDACVPKLVYAEMQIDSYYKPEEG